MRFQRARAGKVSCAQARRGWGALGSAQDAPDECRRHQTKQTLNAAHIAYSHNKIATVRRLNRTSLPIPTVGGLQPAKPPHHILGGLLTVASNWTPPLAEPFATALAAAAPDQQLDLVCIAGVGNYERLPDGPPTIEIAPGAGARFLLSLIARLQDIATVPMIDVRAYAAWLK